MTDPANNNVVPSPPRTWDDFPLDRPMAIDMYIHAIFDQVRVAYPHALIVDDIRFDEIKRILRSVARHGILGENPRRLP